MWSRAACKPSSVPVPVRTALRVGDGHFSGHAVAGVIGAEAPAVHPPPAARAGRRQSRLSRRLHDLARGGVCLAPAVTRRAV